MTKSDSQNLLLDGELLGKTGFQSDTSDSMLSFLTSIGAFNYAKSISKINRAMAVAQLVRIQEAYRKKDSDALAFAASFPEACKKIGLNYKTVNEHIQLMNAFGYEAFEAVEAMGLPIRDQRLFRKLDNHDRSMVIELMTGDATPEDVKNAIRNLYAENMKLKDTLDSAELKEKSQLVEEAQIQQGRAELAESKLKDMHTENERLRNRVKELLASNRPEERVKAFQEISSRLENLLAIIRDSNLNDDDPAVAAEKSKLQILIREASTLLQ